MRLVKDGFFSKVQKLIQCKVVPSWGAWVAQSVKCLTLGLGSGGDLRAVRGRLTSGSTLGMEPA